MSPWVRSRGSASSAVAFLAIEPVPGTSMTTPLISDSRFRCLQEDAAAWGEVGACSGRRRRKISDVANRGALRGWFRIQIRRGLADHKLTI